MMEEKNPTTNDLASGDFNVFLKARFRNSLSFFSFCASRLMYDEDFVRGEKLSLC